LEAAPQSLRPFIELNPLTHIVIMFRDALLGGGGFHWVSWSVSVGMAAMAFLGGWLAIVRVQRIVGDLV
jgi:ABC-type polysaccharide/polyol phosphate export permease